MDKDFWKRELFPSRQRGDFPTDVDWESLDPLKSSPGPLEVYSSSTRSELKEGVIFEQQPQEGEIDNRLFQPYSLALGAACGLLILTVLLVYAFLRRSRGKNNDEDRQSSSSILVFPSKAGSPPQFLTKEINFSLPPLRSNSLGDIVLSSEETTYETDLGTESLLLPTIAHNFRSNSFSCYGLGVIEPALYKSTLDLDEIQWPEGHIGRLWFSLRYEPCTEKLLVSLLKAKNLPSRTIGTVNSCDPFVRLYLMPDERRYLQSRQKKKTCNPYFDETLVFQVSPKDMGDHHTLKLTVIDGGRTKKKGEIGHVTFPLKYLEIGDGLEQQLFKMDLEKEAPEYKTDLGELLISLVYNENISRLTATVIEARRLKDLRKHKQESETCEIEIVANDVRHMLIDLKKWAKPYRPEKRIINMLDGVYIYKEPYGVALIIGAWNYPILLTVGPVVNAIAAGNTVVLKPSELAPHTANLLAKVLTKYLDRDCFQVFLGGIEETTELMEQKFDYIFFTGSTNVGRIIHQAAAKNLTPATLELGGKSPVYLDDSVDMEKATRRILWGKLINSGQTCISPDYMLCTKETENRFLQEAQKILTEFYGSDPKNSTYHSKIVTERHFLRLLDFIKPENLAIGGKFNSSERVLAPTILINVKPSDPIMQEEIFGPILPIINIKDVEEAIGFINEREKPLALYVFTKNKNTKKAMLTRTSSGGTVINDTITHIITENLPFGGVGFSGMGSYHGEQGFETFSHKKSVLVKDFSGFTEIGLSLRYPPYNDAKTTLMNFVLKKRRGISNNILKSVAVFSAGFVCSYVFQFVWCAMDGCNH